MTVYLALLGWILFMYYCRNNEDHKNLRFSFFVIPPAFFMASIYYLPITLSYLYDLCLITFELSGFYLGFVLPCVILFLEQKIDKFDV